MLRNLGALAADLLGIFVWVLWWTAVSDTMPLTLYLVLVVPVAVLMLIRQWIRNREWRKRHTVFIDERTLMRRL